MTVDEAIVWVDPGYDKHQIYVSASRARAKTTLVVDRTAIARHIIADLPLDQQSRENEISSEERLAWLGKRLSQARTNETTLDVLGAAHEAKIAQQRNEEIQMSQEQKLPKRSRSKPREISLD
jgi:hypothetical protein